MKEDSRERIFTHFCRMLLLFFAVMIFTCGAGTHVQAAKQPKATTIQSVANQNGSIKITWKKINKATGYIVYRKKTGGNYKKAATINSNSTLSYTDTSVKSGYMYSYKVVAFNAKGKAEASAAAKTRYLKPVTIKKATVSGNTVTLKWGRISAASKYKIYRKTSTSDYKLIATVGKSRNTYTDKSVTYGKSYTYKICSCRGDYFSTGALVTCSVRASIENVTTKYAMEADVTLTGSGSGYHAKLVMATPTSALSFGIEYDVDAPSPYTGKAFFLVENIHSNNSGGQAYWRVREASLGQTYRLMITLTTAGKCRIYIDGLLIDSVTNTETPRQQVYLRLEGAAKHNGDTVNASFGNIKLKYGSHTSSAHWVAGDMRSASETSHIGITSDYSQFASSRSVTIRGTLRGLYSWQDWDSSSNTVYGVPAYNSISGGVVFTIQ